MLSTLSRRLAPALFRPRAYTAAARPAPPPPLDEGERAIYDKLEDRFSPSELLVQDVSGACASDGGTAFLPSDILTSSIGRGQGGCGSFYAITIASAAFKGMPVVKQHRLVNDVLKKEIEGIHGLQLKTIPQ